MTRPRILVIDDIYGRKVDSGANAERIGLCEAMLLHDVTGDQPASTKVVTPIADAVFCRGQRPVLANPGDVVENDLDDVLAKVRSGWKDRRAGEPPWALVLLDLAFMTGDVTASSHAKLAGAAIGHRGDGTEASCFGFEILSALNPLGRGEFHDLPVAVLSRLPRKDVRSRYSKLGAVGFIEGDEPEPMADVLRGFLWRHGLLTDGQELSVEPETSTSFRPVLDRDLIAPSDARIVGYSIALLAALREARRAALLGKNLFVTGATGTGKELLARYLWRVTRQPARPFVAVDSGALVETLAEDTLFGHVPGAADGMRTSREGKIREADDGDLFLDEIGSIPAAVQLKLLRALSAREVQPLGTDRVFKVNVRYISATDRPVEQWVRAGQFNSALFARLAALRIPTLPPLDERCDDIPLLVHHFFAGALKTLRSTHSRARLTQIDDEVLPFLAARSWPENVRGLKDAVEGAVARAQDVEFLTKRHFSDLGDEVRTPRGDLPTSSGGKRDPPLLGAVRTSGDLAHRLAGPLLELARNHEPPGVLDYTKSRPLIEATVSQLCQDGALVFPIGVELTRLLADAWHRLDDELAASGVKWRSGHNLVRHSMKAKAKALNVLVIKVLNRLGHPGVRSGA